MIFKFNNEQYSLCKKYAMKVYESKEKIEIDDKLNRFIVSDEAMEDFQDAVDYAIIHFGMVNQDSLTDLGVKLQLLYDEIIHQKYRQTQQNN